MKVYEDEFDDGSFSHVPSDGVTESVLSRLEELHLQGTISDWIWKYVVKPCLED